jgi:hypothetical protein
MLREVLIGLSDGPKFKRDVPLVGAGDVIRWWKAVVSS